MAFTDLGNPSAFIFHHTGFHARPEAVHAGLQRDGHGVQYIMDRDGNITPADGLGASHMRPGWGRGAGLSNANTVGMEVIAKDNRDVTPAQIAAAQKFIAEKYPNIPIYGHGEVNPGHKQPDEGLAIVNAIRGARSAQAEPPASYSDEDPRGLADRKTILLPEMPRGPVAPQPMQVAHGGALAGLPAGFPQRPGMPGPGMDGPSSVAPFTLAPSAPVAAADAPTSLAAFFNRPPAPQPQPAPQAAPGLDEMRQASEAGMQAQPQQGGAMPAPNNLDFARQLMAAMQQRQVG